MTRKVTSAMDNISRKSAMPLQPMHLNLPRAEKDLVERIQNASVTQNRIPRKVVKEMQGRQPYTLA
jgi:hypothetical protein